MAANKVRRILFVGAVFAFLWIFGIVPAGIVGASSLSGCALGGGENLSTLGHRDLDVTGCVDGNGDCPGFSR